MTRYDIVDVKPLSEEWRAWRRKVKSASDAPIIMQCAPSYWLKRTWGHLRGDVEVGEPSEETRNAWAHGHQREAAYRQARPYVGEPVNLQRGEYGASLDAANLDDPFGPVWWEIKAPQTTRSKMWTQMPDRDAPDAGHLREALPHIWWQLVHQAWVIGDGYGVCNLVVINPGGAGRHRTMAISAQRLLDDFLTLSQQWDQFTAGGQPGIGAEAWVRAAHQYIEAHEMTKLWAARKQKRRSKLLQLSNEEPEKAMGGGLKVITSKREGSIDWKAMARDHLGWNDNVFDEMAEKYRKPDYQVTQIRRMK